MARLAAPAGVRTLGTPDPRLRHRRDASLDLRDHRKLGRELRDRVRFDLAGGQLKEAADHLSIGFALARNVAQGPTLIESLVGISIATRMLTRTRELMQQPGRRTCTGH